MTQSFSSSSRPALDHLARHHGFSPDAVSHMLQALMTSRGSMAQFNHPEFGGSGQWMRGGLIMLSDMFDHSLKARVDGLCQDLAVWLANQPEWKGARDFQSQSQTVGSGQHRQSGGDRKSQSDLEPTGLASLFAPPHPGPSEDWWGTDLGSPASVGAQNGARYAYFLQARRLAIEIGGRVTLYDTLNHHISGFSQQQSAGGSLILTSQHGLVDISRLPVVSGQTATPPTPVQSNVSANPPTPGNGQAAFASDASNDIFSHIERLADLHAKGLLSAEEFAGKKKELLSRL
ncbi:MAG: SHOCT domain-containing protein [Candidatus Competibacteraceae bacterium]|nr:SHOCT domain-containing protein [Candidatus Competibacteraceae bacterium]